MAAKNKTPVEITFNLDQETKTTVRFEEEGSKETRIMGKVYVKKEQLAKWGDPAALIVTVRPK
jgi:hypothetical protein